MEHLKGNVGVIYPTFEEYPNRKETMNIVAYIPQNKDFSYTSEDIRHLFRK